jgi:hypothetical protein
VAHDQLAPQGGVFLLEEIDLGLECTQPVFDRNGFGGARGGREEEDDSGQEDGNFHDAEKASQTAREASARPGKQPAFRDCFVSAEILLTTVGR